MRLLPLAVLALVLGAMSAGAASPLQGRWEITTPGDHAFSGELVVDSEGRTAFSARVLGSSWVGNSRGYVSRVSDKTAEITLGNGARVGRIRCAVQSPDVLNCDDVAVNRAPSGQYFMRRIGPGPASLLPQ